MSNDKIASGSGVSISGAPYAASRGHVPLLVGGAMMYFHALMHELSDLPIANPGIRAKLYPSPFKNPTYKRRLFPPPTKAFEGRL